MATVLQVPEDDVYITSVTESIAGGALAPALLKWVRRFLMEGELSVTLTIEYGVRIELESDETAEEGLSELEEALTVAFETPDDGGDSVFEQVLNEEAQKSGNDEVLDAIDGLEAPPPVVSDDYKQETQQNGAAFKTVSSMFHGLPEDHVGTLGRTELQVGD